MNEGFKTFYFQPMEAVRFYDSKNRHLDPQDSERDNTSRLEEMKSRESILIIAQ